jgi:hypothetical protein
MRCEAAGFWNACLMRAGRMTEAIAAAAFRDVQRRAGSGCRVSRRGKRWSGWVKQCRRRYLGSVVLTFWRRSLVGGRDYGKSRESRNRTSIVHRQPHYGQAAARRTSPPTPSPPHLPSSPPQRADAMASRQLALSLQQGMRSRAAINAVKSSRSPITRGLATPVAYGSKTESTTLKNGFTVCQRT